MTPTPTETIEDIKKKEWTLDQWKNSDDPIDRTVYFISYQSPHNLWKGCQVIKDLLSHQRTTVLREVREKMQPDIHGIIYIIKKEDFDSLDTVKSKENV